MVELAVGYLISAALESLFAEDPPSTPKPRKDRTPTTLTERGELLAYLVGKRRVGYAFAYASNRTAKNSNGALKYREDGWHILPTGGPGAALHAILEAGEVIWEGPITPLTHPSGTLVKVPGNHGEFRISWGEFDQPVNVDISTDAGISSRFPGHAGIYWISKKLGFSAQWPNIEYIYESTTDPTTHGLLDSPVEMTGTQELVGVDYNISNVNVDDLGYTRVRINGKHKDEFEVNTNVKITGNPLIPDGDHIIVAVDQKDGNTRISIATTITGSPPPQGIVEPYSKIYDSGINPAHIIAHIMFARPPWGMGDDPSAYNFATLEDIALLAIAENLPGSYTSGKKTLRDVLKEIYTDLGVIEYWNPNSGKNEWKAIRPTEGLLPTITVGANSGATPEKTIAAGRKTSDVIEYIMDDVERNYNSNSWTSDDDWVDGFRNLTEKQIVITTNYESAGTIGERRNQEDFVGNDIRKLSAGRDVRALTPGTAVKLENFDTIFRIDEIKPLHLDTHSEIFLLEDAYGVDASGFQLTNSVGPSSQNIATDQPDEHILIVENPFVWNGIISTVLMNRIRANSAVQDGAVFLSTDNGENYSQIIASTNNLLPYGCGGAVIEGFDPRFTDYHEEGPIITAIGPDNASYPEDLLNNETAWLNGRMWAVFGDSELDQQEICFFKRLVAISATQYRLDGVLRARCGTTRMDSVVGKVCHIMVVDAPNSDDQFIVNGLFTYQSDFLIKVQPDPESSTLDLAEDIDADAYRMSDTAIPPGDIWTPRYNSSFVSGEDIVFKWAWSNWKFTPGGVQAGAGLQKPGQAIVTEDFPDGTPLGAQTFFGIIIYGEDGETVVGQSNVTSAPVEFTYTAANRLADFGGSEPTRFFIEVLQGTISGFSKPSRRKEITRV